MDTRASIEAVLDKAYAARRAHDAEAAAALFAENGRLLANGMPSAAEGRSDRIGAFKALFDTFEVVGFREQCRVIDPPRAVVHWRGTFRARNGRVGETDVLDLIEVQDGKIAALTTFFDTAYAASLIAPA